MRKPLVSVIINCYNGEAFLQKAIDSVCSQTYSNWELIVWDNASTDRTQEICEQYTDPRIRVYRAKETTVLGLARKLASDNARGEYLAFLDCDDMWTPDKLEKQIALFTDGSRDIGFSYTRTEVTHECPNKNNVILYEGTTLPSGQIFAPLAKENFIVFSSLVVDACKFRECGGFPSHFRNSTDYWVIMNMASKYPVAVVDEVCCYNRLHSSNLSSSQKVIGAMETIEVVKTFLPNFNVKDALKYHYAKLSVMHLKEGNLISTVRILICHGGWVEFLRRLLSWIGSSWMRRKCIL